MLHNSPLTAIPELISVDCAVPKQVQAIIINHILILRVPVQVTIQFTHLYAFKVHVCTHTYTMNINTYICIC